jgi:hypothetical protein
MFEHSNQSPATKSNHNDNEVAIPPRIFERDQSVIPNSATLAINQHRNLLPQVIHTMQELMLSPQSPSILLAPITRTPPVVLTKRPRGRPPKERPQQQRGLADEKDETGLEGQDPGVDNTDAYPGDGETIANPAAPLVWDLAEPSSPRSSTTGKSAAIRLFQLLKGVDQHLVHFLKKS